MIDDRGHTRGVIDCPCGREVLCYGFTNECDCGRDFNMSGQELAPRSQWGEETGESCADIVQGDYSWPMHDGYDQEDY